MEEGDDRDGHDRTDTPKAIGSMIGAQDRIDFADPVSNRLNEVGRWEVIRVPFLIECNAKYNIRFSIGGLLPTLPWTNQCFGPGNEASKAANTRKP